MKHSSAGLALSCMVLQTLALAGAAVTAGAAEPAVADQSAVALPVLIGPRLKNKDLEAFPSAQELLNEGKEGWVTLQMMVDPDGKPFEVGVIDSSGDEAFRKEALRAAKVMQFEPAHSGTETVSSSYEVKLKFHMPGREKGARREFVSGYKALRDAVSAGNRGLADELMARLKPDNLYEDAYHGVAAYMYAEKWGTPQEQFAALRQAVAGETKATFLPRPLFESVLALMFKMQAQSGRLGAALDTYKTLKALPADAKTLAPLTPIVDVINNLRNGTEPLGVLGKIDTAAWTHTLLRRHFQLQDVKGKIEELKLRCEREYLAFPFDPTLQYSVSPKAGTCRLEVIGDGDTEFTLVET